MCDRPGSVGRLVRVSSLVVVWFWLSLPGVGAFAAVSTDVPAGELRGGLDGQGAWAALLEFLDRDGDGLLSRYEGAEAFLHLVSEADGNGDGVLHEQEALSFFKTSREEEEAERLEFLDELDADRDAALSLSEFPDELRPSFPQVDVDGDGRITASELLSAEDLGDPVQLFEQELLMFLSSVDADGDGSFGLDDLPPEGRMEFEQEFRRLDLNGNDLLSEQELLALVREELQGASFEVRGHLAVVTGVLGASTPGRLLELALEHPEVDTLVLHDVPGSIDDESNLRAARFVRRLGYATHVPADGTVASGGTDFFLAGATRTAETGARFGVHSWGGLGEEGSLVPADDPEHEKYLSFYRDMAIPEAFYWFTLHAASAEDIHWMTPVELERFRVLSTGSGPEPAAPQTALAKVGGCVLAAPAATAPEDLFHVGRVLQKEELAPLSKTLMACGIELAAEQEVPDVFLERVGAVVAEIFRVTESTDERLQQSVMKHLYEYKALLPVPRSEESLARLERNHAQVFEELEASHSVCDIIMAEVPRGLVMEVVEHVLHTVSDVGLHVSFPEAWGLDRGSLLWAAMQEAIQAGHYDVTSYDYLDGAPQDVVDRILLQEFAYWFITTAWDLQGDYGPDEDEWTVRDPRELRAAMPEFYAVYERTAGRVLSAPRPQTLAAIGPTRAEEGR